MKTDAEKKPEICRFLKIKNSFGMLEGGGQTWSGIDDPNATFWCNRTSGPAGPDNNPVSANGCVSRRKCFSLPDQI